MWLIIVSISAILVTIALGYIAAVTIWKLKGKHSSRKDGEPQ